MPKIIPNIREELLNEAKKQILEHGYGKTTIRSVANACNLGVGTVYNYFKSKDMLIATFMAEDWKKSITDIENHSSDNPEEVLLGIYKALDVFMVRYRALFCDSEAEKTFAAVFAERHKQLRDQLAKLILPICQNSSIEDKKYLAEYLAESLITWTVAGISFHKQYSIASKILQ